LQETFLSSHMTRNVSQWLTCLGACLVLTACGGGDTANTAAGGVWRTFVPGLNEATIQLGRLQYSSGSSGPVFVDRQALAAPLYLELWPSGTGGHKFECYARIQGDAHQISVTDLGQENVTLKADGPVYYTTTT
jgi:hypothetical protein